MSEHRPALDVDGALNSIDTLLWRVYRVQRLVYHPEAHVQDNAISPQEAKSAKSEEANSGTGCCGVKAASIGGGNRAALTGAGDSGSTSMEEVKTEAAATGSPKPPPSSGKKHGKADSPTVDGRGDDSKVNTEKLLVYNQAEMLLRDLDTIKSELWKLKALESDFRYLDYPSEQLHRFLIDRDSDANLPIQVLQTRLRSLAQMVKVMKNQMPGHSIPASYVHDSSHSISDELEFKDYHLLDKEPIPDMMERIRGVSCFREFLEDFQRAFEGLDLQSKLCLCSFSIFPEDAIVRKKILAYWWISEGLLDPRLPGNKTINEVLRELCSNGFIKPVLKKRKLSGFEMDPLVRFVVITFAERLGFFSFDSMGIPTADFSFSHRACLVKTKEGYFSRMDLTRDKDSDGWKKNMDNLQTLFNVNDPYPDFHLAWFIQLRRLNVLYLGGWQGSKGHHIEVMSTEFLRGLRNIKCLKVLSLQGVSRVAELPEFFYGELSSLEILDLNACHHLELLPKGLGNLENLTHLDVSECYFLDHIPKGLGQLKKLQVLKGFVIGSWMNNGDSCTLADLKGLKRLRKFSITSRRDDFPSENEVTILQAIEHLKKLKIVWGGGSKKAEPTRIGKGIARKRESTIAEPKKWDKGGREEQQHDASAESPQTVQSRHPAQPAPAAKLTSTMSRKLGKTFTFRSLASKTATLESALEKLELQRCPLTEAPTWMVKGKLKPSKKLYIKGGNLETLKDEQGNHVPWSVNILCLKYLADLEMDWSELQKLFPRLVYLENTCCPKLALCPCSSSGIWINRNSELLDEVKLDLSWSFLK